MDNAEVEVALEELESRLERLRALYEQYFMGIERIEPQVPRKDVDRRIYLLRREKIRNTAKRFKLQTIISRYNTFQQYWQRICREIENGTYKRHVIRAERIAPGQMLTIAARKRLGKAALEAIDEDVPRAAHASTAPPSAPPSAAPPAAPSVPPRPSAVPRPGIPSLLGKAPAKPGLRPPPKPGVPTLTAAPPDLPAPPPTAAAPAPAPARAPAPSAFDLDLDFLGDWDPSTAPSKPKRAPAAPAEPFGRALTQRLGAEPAPSVAAAAGAAAARPHSPLGAAPKAAAPTAAEQPLVAPAFVSQRLTPPTAPATRGAPAGTTRAPLPLPASPTQVAPGAIAPPTPNVAVSSPVPRAAAPAPPAKPASPPARPLPAPLGARALAPPIPDRSPLAPSVAKVAAPVAIKPPAAPAAPARPAPPKPAAPMPAAVAPAHDERVRELHARLLEAKRQTQDASAVSMEGLARSMKATEAKLREQHKNRKIDFDVVIKDGKAVLKPIVR